MADQCGHVEHRFDRATSRRIGLDLRLNEWQPCPEIEGFGVEVEHDCELHVPHVPQYSMLTSARAWAGILVAELFQDAHILDRDAAYELVDTITTVTEEDLPWTLTTPSLDLVVRLYAVERV